MCMLNQLCIDIKRGVPGRTQHRAVAAATLTHGPTHLCKVHFTEVRPLQQGVDAVHTAQGGHLREVG